MRCLRLRPRRSRRHTTSASNLHCFASLTSLSRAGRRSLVPDTPRSTNSTAVQPRAVTYRRSSASWFSGSGEFERVGEERTRTVDVRILAATNRNLKQEVDAGRFRQDLYYRLNVFPVDVPPLSQRDEDIPRLAAHYLRRAAARMKRPCPTLTQANVLQLLSYDWPGNVRELQNVIERAVIVSGTGPLQLDLPATSETMSSPTVPPATPTSRTDVRVVHEDKKREQDRGNIVAALQKTNWKIAGKHGAADLVGLKPSTLASRIKRLGIVRGD